MRSRLGIALFRGEKKVSAGLALRTTALCFMGAGPFRRGDAVRDNRLEEAQPPEADHQSARRMEAGITRRRAPVRLGRLSSGGVALRADYASSAATGFGFRVATE